jgi:hypothetical protein
MMKIYTLIILIISMLVLSACGLVSFVPKSTPTIIPTQTALPTYTPMPTYTPYPTATTVPTAMPTFTEVPSNTIHEVNGVELKFKEAKLSLSPVVIEGETFTPDTGYSVLVITGTYRGDLDSLFGDNGVYQEIGTFVVTDSDNLDYEWVYEFNSWQNVETNGEFQVIYFVKTDTGPYVLRSTIETPFTIDLTKLMSNA